MAPSIASSAAVAALELPVAPTRRRPLLAIESADRVAYFAGPENRLAAGVVAEWIAAASQSPETADSPSQTPSLAPPSTSSSLTLVGPSGCGKSVLAGGVAAAWLGADPERVVVTSGVDLRRRIDQAIAQERQQPGSVAAIGDRLTAARLLVIEDLSGLAPSPAAVERLVQAIEGSSALRLLVTNPKPLGETAGLTARLVSRLAQGLIVGVAAPAEATRSVLLASAVEARGGCLEPDAARLLAASLPPDGRAVLTMAESLRGRRPTRKPITVEDAREWLEAEARDATTVPLVDIVAVVARYYRMPLKQLRSSSRKAPVVLARAMAIYLARQLTPLSYDEIGQYLGGRDHSTVMHNHRRVENRLPRDRAMRSAVDDLLRLLGQLGGEA